MANARLGVSGGWLQLLAWGTGRTVTEPWRIWFNVALVAGAAAAGLLGSWTLHGYGDLSVALSPVVLVPVLLLVGLLIGYGARWAGGCTSGHGLSGCAAGSRESLAATATFFGVAVAVTFTIHALTGGAV